MKISTSSSPSLSTVKTVFSALAFASVFTLSACGKQATLPTTAERLKVITQNQAPTLDANPAAPKTASAVQAGIVPTAK